MSLASIARQIVPPFIYNALKRKTLPNEYGTFEEAQQDCGAAGYNSDELAAAVLYYTQSLRDSYAQRPRALDLPEIKNLFVVSQAVRDGRLCVVDLGGACGAHYWLVRSWLPPDVSIRWHVVEMPAMVRAAQALACEELQFHESLDAARLAAGVPDLAYSSGTLHCMSDPAAALRELMALGARHLFITRQGLSEAGTVITVQRRKISGGVPKLPPGMVDRTIAYPLTWINRDAFEAALSERYDILLRINEDNPIGITRFHRVPGYGYFCVLRDA